METTIEMVLLSAGIDITTGIQNRKWVFDIFFQLKNLAESEKENYPELMIRFKYTLDGLKFVYHILDDEPLTLFEATQIAKLFQHFSKDNKDLFDQGNIMSLYVERDSLSESFVVSNLVKSVTQPSTNNSNTGYLQSESPFKFWPKNRNDDDFNNNNNNKSEYAHVMNLFAPPSKNTTTTSNVNNNNPCKYRVAPYMKEYGNSSRTINRTKLNSEESLNNVNHYSGLLPAELWNDGEEKLKQAMKDIEEQISENEIVSVTCEDKVSRHAALMMIDKLTAELAQLQEFVNFPIRNK